MSNETKSSKVGDGAAPGTVTRRSDLDALRGVAMVLGIVLHACLAYFPFPWPVRDTPQPALGFVFAAIHGFRMPLFFLLSGFFTMMVLRRRGLRNLIQQRLLRIGLPLVLAMLTILPLNQAVFSWALHRDLAAAGRRAPLIEAILAEDVPAVVAATRSAESLAQLDPRSGSTPLAVAAMTGNTEIVQTLIDAGADLTQTNSDSTTSLQAACLMGEAEVVKQLLAYGVDATARDALGRTALDSLRVPASVAMVSREFLGIAPRAFAEAVRGKEEALSALASLTRELPPQGILDRLRSGYETWLAAPAFHVQLGSVGIDLFASEVFHHLWFLWFLCWLVGMMATAEMLGCAPTGRFRWWIVLVPCAAQVLMWSPFGPDTPFGLLPAPHLLVYYGSFYWFGASTYAAEGTATAVGRRWRVTLPLAFLVLFPAAIATIGERPWAVVLQPAYAWMASLGVIGLFSRFFSKPSAKLPWLSDASYWMYLVHFPLVIMCQSLLIDRAWPGLVKVVIVNGVVVVILLVTYRWCVRYTLVGTLLNGPRTRAADLLA